MLQSPEKMSTENGLLNIIIRTPLIFRKQFYHDDEKEIRLQEGKDLESGAKAGENIGYSLEEFGRILSVLFTAVLLPAPGKVPGI